MISIQLKPDWKMVKFGEVVKNVNLVERDPKASGIERVVGLEHIDPESLHVRRWHSIEDSTSFTRKFAPGQTLFGKRRAYQRKVAYAEFEGICSSDILTFEPKKGKALLLELLPFICQSDAFFDHALDTSAGSLSPRTSWKALQDFQFPLPPLNEQKRISNILWAADEAVQTISRVVSELSASRQKLIDSIIPDPDDYLNRTIVRLYDLCSMQNGRSFPSSAYSEHGFKLLRPGNLASDGTLNWGQGSTVRLDRKYLQENADLLIRPDDIVINLTAQSLDDGFIGRVCLAVEGDDCLLNQRLGRFLCIEEVESEYLYRVLQTSRFRRMVEARCEGSKVRHTYFRHLADFPLVKVSIEEQRKIILAANSIDMARKTAMNSARDSRALLSQLTNQLIGTGIAACV